jgi:hypothetical protein
MSTILFRAKETLEGADESISGKSPRTLAKPVQKPSRNHLQSSDRIRSRRTSRQADPEAPSMFAVKLEPLREERD